MRLNKDKMIYYCPVAYYITREIVVHFFLFFLLNLFIFYEGGDEHAVVDRDGLGHQFLLDGDDKALPHHGTYQEVHRL